MDLAPNKNGSRLTINYYFSCFLFFLLCFLRLLSLNSIHNGFLERIENLFNTQRVKYVVVLCRKYSL